MSIIIIAFPAAPKVDPEAVRKDEELNKSIKQKVTGKHTYLHQGDQMEQNNDVIFFFTFQIS